MSVTFQNSLSSFENSVDPDQLASDNKADGVQWLSGRMVDSRSRGCGFEPHRSHCIVSLSKTLYYMLSTG